MIRLADRILVFEKGVIVGELDNTRDYDEMSRQIISMMVGPATGSDAARRASATGS
jgi:ABC-type sugar transport system ATPase subunit